MAPPSSDIAASVIMTNTLSVSGRQTMEVDAADDAPPSSPTAADMGYEECHPARRRGSMSAAQQKERRASIKAIMADPTISPLAKRRSIQHLMDGRRNSMSGHSSQGSFHSSASSSSGSSPGTPELSDHEYAQHPDHYSQQHPEILSFTAAEDSVGNNEQARRAEMTRPPCSHYERNCTMIAPCCGAAFGCRICHDDCPVLPPKMDSVAPRRYHRSASLPSSFTCMEISSTPEDNHHLIDRFAVSEIICRRCYARQSSKTNDCQTCGVRFGEYHCNICNLWMSNAERPYHCADCGFCRVGGAENFRHCDECGMCIDKTLYTNHNCKQGKYKSNCPVCQEYLFSSRSASHEMPCGHAIHWDCFRQLAAHDSRCPVCKKTAETRERMMPTWTAMAAAVALQPVPLELARVVVITCNDCERAEDGRAWHFLGVQCSHCSSFNTVVDRIVLSGEEAHQYLEVREAQLSVAAESSEGGEQQQARRPRRRVNRRRSAF